jgi:uncharacterized SAM-binding protein YcdF (DUF218 family)
VACLAAVAVIVGGGLFYRKQAAEALLQRLYYVHHFSPAPVSPSPASNIVYVLGGTEKSLKWKIQTAARLVRKGKASRLLVLSQAILMEYRPALGRNVSADEWVLEIFKASGVSSDMIEFVVFKGGFFGTWSEADHICRLANERGYQNLILVTAPYHTRRVWESFSHKIKKPGTQLFLYASDETVYFRYLVLEYVKLIFYRVFLF